MGSDRPCAPSTSPSIRLRCSSGYYPSTSLGFSANLEVRGELAALHLHHERIAGRRAQYSGRRAPWERKQQLVCPN